jgi:poly-beta-hydroxyalkanoate depolymerase
VALLAVEGAIDHIAGVGQRRGELAVEIGIVFDDEKAQGDLRVEECSRSHEAHSRECSMNK